MGTASPDTEYLYVAGTTRRPGYEHRIRIVQIAPDHSVRWSDYLPDHYPSFQASGPVSILPARSAFGDRNYLYLAWADRETSELYVSIIQNWDDGDGADTWFTRSARMGVVVRAGPSWIDEGAPAARASARLVMALPDFGGALRYAFLYGRY